MFRKDIVTFGGTPVTLEGEEIKVGDVARDFTCLDVDLKEVKLSDFKGKEVIISVVPSVDTSVCAAQTRRFNEEASKNPDVVVLTISVDLPFALGRFCAAEGLESVKTLSDHRNLDFALKYGFNMKELRILARGLVVVGADNVVKYVEYVPEVGNHPDYDAALKAL